MELDDKKREYQMNMEYKAMLKGLLHGYVSEEDMRKWQKEQDRQQQIAQYMKMANVKPTVETKDMLNRLQLGGKMSPPVEPEYKLINNKYTDYPILVPKIRYEDTQAYIDEEIDKECEEVMRKMEMRKQKDIERFTSGSYTIFHILMLFATAAVVLKAIAFILKYYTPN